MKPAADELFSYLRAVKTASEEAKLNGVLVVVLTATQIDHDISAVIADLDGVMIGDTIYYSKDAKVRITCDLSSVPKGPFSVLFFGWCRNAGLSWEFDTSFNLKEWADKAIKIITS